jgi:hypothetical protein
MRGALSTNSTTFDLIEIVEWERKRHILEASIQTSVATGLGVALIVIGLYVGFIRGKAVTPTDWYAGVALPLVGLAMVLTAWSTPGGVRRSPNLLEISDEGLSYGYRNRSSLKTLRWNDPRLRFQMRDARATSQRLGNRYKYSPFSVLPSGTLRIPLTQPAFEAILEASAKHGLHERRSSIGDVAILTFTPRR